MYFSDLELNAFFDPDTKQSTRYFFIKQNYWNKYYFAIEYNIKTGQVGIRKLYFQGNILKKYKVLKNNKIKSIPLTETYNNKFKLLFILCKMRYAFTKFIQKPRIPKTYDIDIVSKLIHQSI